MNHALESVEVNVSIDENSYDTLLQKGLELREEADGLSWKLGDLAIEASVQFEKGLFKQFSREIGVKVATLKRYRDVAKAYPEKEVRRELAILSWSHFRQVAANPDRVQILRRACDDNWSVEKLKKMTSGEPDVIDDGKNVPPRPKLNFCLRCRKWYIPKSEDQCKEGGNCDGQ